MNVLYVLAQANPGKTGGDAIKDVVFGAAVPLFLCAMAITAFSHFSERHQNSMWKWISRVAVIGMIVLAPTAVVKIFQATADYFAGKF